MTFIKAYASQGKINFLVYFTCFLQIHVTINIFGISSQLFGDHEDWGQVRVTSLLLHYILYVLIDIVSMFKFLLCDQRFVL